jgi:hypothetical protein
MASKGNWGTLMRYLPTPLRIGANELEDKAPEEGDDSIQPVDDPFTSFAGAAAATGGARLARAAAPQLERLMADEIGGVRLPRGARAPTELNMEELPRKMRAIDQGADPTKEWFHGTHDASWLQKPDATMRTNPSGANRLMAATFPISRAIQARSRWIRARLAP